MVSAVPPVQSTIVAEKGLEIEITVMNYIQQNADHSFRFRVYNASNNAFMGGDQVNCSFGLIGKNGIPIYQVPDVTPTGYVFIVNVDGGNFSQLGSYHQGINCQTDDGSAGGVKTSSFEVNGYGEQLDTAHSIKFNSAMLFMMILFLLALAGIFGFENITGKFACYWIAHILFVVGTFSMWQFNMGYTTTFTGMAGVWKVMFYVSTIAMLPMMIMSIAMMIVYYTTGKEVQRLIDKGMPEAEAYRRQGGKYK